MTDGQEDETVDYFRVYRAEPEAVFDIPATDEDRRLLTISIAALGGGTVGEDYADNDWIYAVHADGELVASGIDLHCGGVARTHQQMAAVLAVCLAAAIVGFVADGEQPPLVVYEQAERLSLWANDIQTADADDR
jgi:hypothetical protein